MGQALDDTTRPLLVTSGVAMLASQGAVATEQDAPTPPSAAYPRRSEAAITASCRTSCSWRESLACRRTEAREHVGWFAGFAGMNAPASSA
jgi:hypothetical protein